MAATLDAYPDWKIPCHVIAIIPTADRQRATVEVRVGFDELDPRILPDMGVKVAFQESEAETQRSPAAGGLTLPREAVRREQGRDYVLVVRDGKVERRAVATGAANDVSVTVISGLAPGESVVIEGPGDLLDGTAVKEK